MPKITRKKKSKKTNNPISSRTRRTSTIFSIIKHDRFYKLYMMVFNFHKQKFNTVDPLTKVNYYIDRLGEEINKENNSEERKTDLIKYKKSFECHRCILVKGFDSFNFMEF